MRRVVVACTLLVALVGATAAHGWLTAVGSGRGSAGVGTLAASSVASATAGAGVVAIGWTAVTPPSAGATVTYSLTRNGGTPGGNCPTAAAPSTAVSCVDSGLTFGTYTYAVTAHWRTWTSTGATTDVAVASGPLDHFLLGASTTTPTAGQPDDLAITAKDAQNHTVSTYGGDHGLTFGGAGTIGSFSPTVTDKNGTAVAFGSAETIAFANGVAGVTGSRNGVMTLYKAGNPTITVGDGSHSGSLSVAVVPAAAASFLATAPSSATAGSSFSLTLTARDAYGNVATGYTGSKTIDFSGPHSSPNATAPSYPASVDFSGGVAVASVTLVAAETTSISAVEHGTTIGGATGAITVAPAAAASFAVGATGSATAGTAFSITLTAKDAYGNTAVGYSGAKTIDFSGPHSSPNNTAPSYPASVGFSGGVATASVTLVAAETTAVTAAERSTAISGTSAAVAVGPGAAAAVGATSGGGQSAQVGSPFANPLTATVTDAYGNLEPGVTVTFTAPASGAGAGFLASGGICSSSGATAGSCAATTNAGGIATSSTFTANAIAGSYTIVASTPGAASASFGETNTSPTVAYQGSGAAQSWTATGTQTVSLPAGVQQSDLLVLVVSATTDKAVTGNVTAPAGWTKQAFVTTAVAGNNDVQLHVFTKTASSSEAAPAVAVTATGSQPATARIVDYRGSAGAAPTWDTTGSANASGAVTGGATGITPAGVTTSTGNERAISIVAQRTSATLALSPAQSFAIQYQNASSAVTAGLADRVVATAGAVAEPTWTSSASGVTWVYVSAALKP